MNRITIEGIEADMPATFDKLHVMCLTAEPMEMLGRSYFVISVTIERHASQFYAARRMRVVLQEVEAVPDLFGPGQRERNAAIEAAPLAMFDMAVDLEHALITFTCDLRYIEAISDNVEKVRTPGVLIRYVVRP